MYAQNLVFTGKYTVAAGGTAEVKTCGFQPRYVRAFNVNNLAVYEYFEGMTDDYMVKHITDGTISQETSGGITVSANGFTLGTAIMDTTSDVVYVVAYR